MNPFCKLESKYCFRVSSSLVQGSPLVRDRYRSTACQQAGHTNKQTPIRGIQAACKTTFLWLRKNLPPRTWFLMPKRLGGHCFSRHLVLSLDGHLDIGNQIYGALTVFDVTVLNDLHRHVDFNTIRPNQKGDVSQYHILITFQ